MALIIPGVEVKVVKEVLSPQLAPSGVLGLVGIVETPGSQFSQKTKIADRKTAEANCGIEVVTTAKACIVRQRATNVVAHGETRDQLLVDSYSWWMTMGATETDRGRAV